jgi:ribosomal protein L30/L7E
VLTDTPENRGRVEKVKHLVVVETLEGAESAQG